MYLAEVKNPPCREGSIYYNLKTQFLMSTKVNDFFEKARNLPLKERVEKRLVDIPIDFVNVFSTAKQMTLSEASLKPANYKQRNYMAELMYGNVIGILYDNYPELMRKDEQNRPYIFLDSQTRLYLKKLTENYLPNNIKTDHVKKMNMQQLFDEEDQIHILYAGFVLNMNDWTQNLKEVCVSYINRVYNTRSAWIIDLQLNEYRKHTSIVTYLDTTVEAETTLVTVPSANEQKTGTDNK